MAEKYLSYKGLKEYDGLLKGWTHEQIESHDLDIKDWTLDQLEGIEAAGTIRGYYYNGAFYSDALHTELIEAKENFLYVDLGDGNKLYIYNGSAYELVSDSGSAEVSLNETTVACGGISKGTDLTGMSLQEILEAMLSPYVAPSGAYLSIAKNKTGYVEYGDTCNITMATVGWSNGSVPVSSIELRLDGSDTIIGTATPSSGDTTAPIDFDDMVLGSSPIIFKATLNITGHDSINVSSTASNNFVYPIYYGSSSVTADNLTDSDVQGKTKLISSGTQTLAFTTSDAYPMIASTRRISKVTDSSGITDYTNAFIGSETQISLSSDNPTWGPVTYYVYTGSRATLTGFQFKFTF